MGIIVQIGRVGVCCVYLGQFVAPHPPLCLAQLPLRPPHVPRLHLLSFSKEVAAQQWGQEEGQGAALGAVGGEQLGGQAGEEEVAAGGGIGGGGLG
jgi:hypothetical protein